MSTLSENLRPNNGIVSFMGVDGIGKTKFSQELVKTLTEKGVPAVYVQGTNEDGWDLPQKDRLQLRALRAASEGGQLEEREFFRLRTAFAYRYTNELGKKNQLVVLDSDPLMKWLVWESIHGQSVERSFDRFCVINESISGGTIPGTVVYLRPPDNSDLNMQLIYDLIISRKITSRHDPSDILETRDMVRACDLVFDYLSSIQPRVSIALLSVVRNLVSSQKSLEDLNHVNQLIADLGLS